MSDQEHENLGKREQGEDHDARDEILEEQEHKGYGEDEGEREESLPE
jgi:hypothetical protein